MINRKLHKKMKKHYSVEKCRQITFIRLKNAIRNPSQIARDNNKFIFSHVKQGARAKDLEDALEWLVNAGIAYKLKLVSNPELPLSGMADNTKAKSLHIFCNRYHPKMAVKTSLKNVGDNRDGDTHVWSIPLYLIFRLKEYVMHEMGW